MNMLITTPDLSSLAGQRSHYSAIHARLRSAPLRAIRIVYRAPLPTPVEKVTPLNLCAAPSWKFLVALAAAKHAVEVGDIFGPARTKRKAAARHEAMALVYQHTQSNLSMVGRLFSRDHTTVLNALRKLRRTRKLVDALEHAVKASRPKPGKIVRAMAPKTPPAPKPPKARAPRKPSMLQKAAARAVRHDVPTKTLAEAYGCNPRSLKVVKSRLKSKLNWEGASL